MQSDNHYRSLAPANNEVDIPAAWLEQIEAKPRQFYCGGGSKLFAAV